MFPASFPGLGAFSITKGQPGPWELGWFAADACLFSERPKTKNLPNLIKLLLPFAYFSWGWFQKIFVFKRLCQIHITPKTIEPAPRSRLIEIVACSIMGSCIFHSLGAVHCGMSKHANVKYSVYSNTRFKMRNIETFAGREKTSRCQGGNSATCMSWI